MSYLGPIGKIFHERELIGCCISFSCVDGTTVTNTVKKICQVTAIYRVTDGKIWKKPPSTTLASA